ncbi:Crp/Fnr family transcriptional regulator [Ancylobacter lacus]|nr:Crp/Fnr family transcriptional regulator [Ancylobacter lacus]
MQVRSNMIPFPLNGTRQAQGACADCGVKSRAVCAGLAPEETGILTTIMSTVTLAPNQLLFEQGDLRSRAYTLTSGMLRLSVSLPDGRRQIAGFVTPGDYLGLSGEDVHTQAAEAVTACRLCSFPVPEMNRLMEQHPRLRDRLHELTRKALLEARGNLLMLGRLTPNEKLARFLLGLSDRAVENGQPATPLALPMTRTDIADYLGLTIETVSRSFSALKTRGLIQLADAHRVEICDRPGLTALAGLPV